MKDLVKGQKIFFWWSSSEVMAVTFIKYVRMRMGTGREDTNKIGIGVRVESYLFPDSKGEYNGLRKKRHNLRPYMPIYRTYKSARNHCNEIKRPSKLVKMS